MANSYLEYDTATAGGAQLAKLVADTVAIADRWRDMSAWMLQIVGDTPAQLDEHADFGIAAGKGGAVSDTCAQIKADVDEFMVDSREKLARLNRGE